MTKDDIIRMAREAKLSITPARSGEYHGGMVGGDAISLSRFAAQVAAAEREACAQVCDDFRSGLDSRTAQAEGWAAAECFAAIRARSAS